MIAKSETHYLSAIRADMTATAEFPPDERNRVLQELATNGKSRTAITCRVSVGDAVHATMSARYAVRRIEGGRS